MLKKLLVSIFIGLCSLGTAGLSCADSGQVILAITSNVPENQHKNHFENTAQLLFDLSQRNPSILVIDAVTGSELGIYTAEDNKKSKTLKGRTRANGELFYNLRNSMKGNLGNEFGDYGANIISLVNKIGNEYRVDGITTLVVSASPIFQSPTSPDWSMAGGLVCSDGCIIAASEYAIYGTNDKADLLEQVQVHWLTPPEQSWHQTRFHGDRVLRFWDLYIKGLGGTLSSFTDSQAGLVRRSNARTKPRSRGYGVHTSDRKIYMIDFSNQHALPTNSSIFDAAITTTPMKRQDIANATNAALGISWTEKHVDLDIWVVPQKNAAPIYYGNPNTRFGTLLKDYRSAPQGRGREEIRFTGHIDLSKALVGVNWYSGDASALPISVELLVRANGKTWSVPFEIHSNSGNRGKNHGQFIERKRAPSKHWVLLDIAAKAQ